MKEKTLVIGIDIGGTYTKFGLVDEEGNCLSEGCINTNPSEGAEKLFSRIFKEINILADAVDDDYSVAGIGIGAPNANYYKGTVELPPNLGWGKVDILGIVKRHSTLPAVITNDANAAAIGEMQFGAAKGMKNFVVITLGTGLGSGIVVNGELVYGADGFAGEIGHTIFDPEGRLCGCGRKGCLETYASATGLRKTVKEMVNNTDIESVFRVAELDFISAKDIYEAALQKDKIALKAFDYTGYVLGLKLADTVAHLSPEAIILVGGLANAGKFIFEPTKKYLEENLLNIFKNKVKLLPSGLKYKNTAVLGAAALILNELKKNENLLFTQ